MTAEYDQEIMDELLAKVGKRIGMLTPNELEYLTELLVKRGIYARYCVERVDARGG